MQRLMIKYKIFTSRVVLLRDIIVEEYCLINDVSGIEDLKKFKMASNFIRIKNYRLF